MSIWDHSASSHVSISEDDLRVTYHEDAAGTGVALGSAVMKGTEEHAFTVTLHKSKMNDGGGIFIGLIDACATAQGTNRKAWGLHPSDGKMYECKGAAGNGTLLSELVKDGVCGHSTGATFKLIVNMQLHKAYYCINGSPPIDCGVRLPESVLPWVQFMWAEASVSLSDYEGPEQRGELKDRLQRSLVLANEAKQRAEEAERKVAAAEAWREEMQAMLAREPDSDLVRRLKGRVTELETSLQEAQDQLEAKTEKVEKLEVVKESAVAQTGQVSEEVEKLKKENAELKAAAAQAGQIGELQQANADLKAEVDVWQKKAWAEMEKVKKLTARILELESQENSTVATVEAGQGASAKLTESPASPAIAPLMMFGARAEQGEGGDYKTTAVGTVEVKMLMDAWNGGDTGIDNPFVIKRVEGIKVNEALEQKFHQKTKIIDSQMATLKARKDDTFTDPDGDKAAIVEKLAKQYTRTDGLGHAKLMMAFHGCDAKSANKVCSEGFELIKKDSRYGRGCKVSTCAAQVARALINTPDCKTGDGCYVLIVCWVVPGPVYPISRGSDYKSGDPHSKYANKNLKPPFMAHYACIGPDGESLAGAALSGPTDDVMIVQAHEQLLPAYRIYFTEK